MSKKSKGTLFQFNIGFVRNPANYGPINLYQVGEVGMEQGGEVDYHKQICHEISYIVSGEGDFFTENTKLSVKKGDIHLVSKNTMHKIVSSSSRKLRYIYIGFDFNDNCAKSEMSELIEFYKNVPVKIKSDFGEIRMLLDMLVSELYSNSKYKQIVIENMLMQTLIYVYRLFSCNDGSVNKNKVIVGQTIYGILKYIDRHIYEIQELRDITKNLSFNESYVSHLFKQKTGVPIMEYVRDRKIEVSLDLLKEQKMSVTAIADILGYGSSQAFNKAFKKKIGCSPTEYKEKIAVLDTQKSKNDN